MKQIILAIACCISSTAFAQFKVTGGSITVQNGAILTLDSLTLQPNTNMSIGNTELQISNSPSPANSGNTINKIYSFTNPINFSGTATLQYADAELNGNTESGLKMIYSTTSSPVTWITTTGSVVNTSGNTLTQTFNNTTIGSISATSNTTPLALELLNFDAQKSKDQRTAILSWTLSSTENLKSFEVEKSGDAKTFSTLGLLTANQKLSYELNDENPFNGKNYYRLKMIDKQETVSYSEVKSLNFGKTNSEVSLYPNPAQTTFTIHTSDASLLNTQAVVYDLNGKMITQFSLQSETTTVSAQNWITGMYIIRLENGQVFKLEKR